MTGCVFCAESVRVLADELEGDAAVRVTIDRENRMVHLHQGEDVLAIPVESWVRFVGQSSAVVARGEAILAYQRAGGAA